MIPKKCFCFFMNFLKKITTQKKIYEKIKKKKKNHIKIHKIMMFLNHFFKGFMKKSYKKKKIYDVSNHFLKVVIHFS